MSWPCRFALLSIAVVLGLLACPTPNFALAAYVQPRADVSVSLQPDTDAVAQAGSAVDYTLVVGDTGPQTATGVEVALSTSNLLDLKVSGACSALPCMIDSLGANTNASIFIHATVAENRAISLSARARPRQFDPDPSNNTVKVSVQPLPLPQPEPPPTPVSPASSASPAPLPPPPEPSRSSDLSISILPSSGREGRPDGWAAYRLIVGNAGPATARGVRISVTDGGLQDAQIEGDCRRLPCVINALPAGATAAILVQQPFPDDEDLQVTAQAQSRGIDSDPSNNTASLTIPRPDGEWGEWWVLAIAAAGLAAAAVGVRAGIVARNRVRWRRMLSLRGDRGAGDSFAAGPLSFSAPALSMDVHCVSGACGPRGPVPILKVQPHV